MTASTDDDPCRLGAQLGSADADTRAEAAERLAQAAEAAAPATLPLVRACGDDDERVREWAVSALEGIGPPPAEALEGLTALVGNTVPLVGYWAATLLGRAGQDGAVAVAALAACVASGGAASVRQRAAWALGRIGPAAEPARAVLEQARTSADERLARLAGEALEALQS